MTPRASLPTARLACASGRPWVDLLRLCLAQLDGLTDADDLGFVFMGDPVTDHADTILDQLVAATGIGRWVGAGGVGLFCGGRELEQGGALAVATLSMPERRLHLVQGEKAARRGAGDGRAILHLPCDHVTSATGRWDLGSIGGRLSSGFDAAQIAGGRCHAGVSGIRFEADTPFVAGLMHGTRPLGGWRPVTSSLGGRLLEIEGRPAAAVVAEEIGEVLARQPSLVCRRILIEVAGAGETGPEGQATRP